MLRELIRIANRLDLLGLSKEADILDSEILKIATEGFNLIHEGEVLRILSERNLDKHISSFMSTPFWGWEDLNKKHPEEKQIILDPESYLPKHQSRLSGSVKQKITTLQDLINENDQKSEEYERMWDLQEADREKKRIEGEARRQQDEAAMKKFVDPRYESMRGNQDFARGLREREDEAARIRNEESQAELARSILEGTAAIFTRENLERLYGMKDYDRWVELTKGPQEVLHAIMRKDLNEIVEDVKPKGTSKDLKELLVGIRKAYRDTNNKSKSSFEQRYKAEQSGDPSISAPRSETVSAPVTSRPEPSREERTSLYGGFQKVDPRGKVRIFFEAPDISKRDLIVNMSESDLNEFWSELSDSNPRNLNNFKEELAKPWFDAGLKMIFAQKLVRFIHKKLSEDPDAKVRSIEELKKFWSLLPVEDRAALREMTKGGSSSTFRSDKSNKLRTVIHEPADISKENISYERLTEKERRELEEQKQLEEQGILPKANTSGEEGQPYRMIGEVNAVSEIESTDYCIFQLVPVNRNAEKTIWLLRGIIRPDLDHSEFDEDPRSAFRKVRDIAQQIADPIEAEYKEKYKDTRGYNKQISDEGDPGDCIVVEGDEAAQLVESKIATLRLKAWSGKDVSMPVESAPSAGGSSVGKNRSESLYESDPGAKKREELPTVFRPKEENIDPNLGTIAVDPKTGEIPTMGGSPSRPKSKGKNK